jgi:hypothetical protein
MNWTLKLERIDEAVNLHSTTVAYVETAELIIGANRPKAWIYAMRRKVLN